MFGTVKTIVHDGPLRVLYAPGRNDTLVISCSGVGTARKTPPPPEFFAMATAKGDNHVMFVIDESRSWLNRPGMAERLIATIEEVAVQSGAARLVGVGNSMGATMLLHLSRDVAFDTILALTPQYSVDPSIVPEERRWRFFRRRIGRFRYPTVAGLRPERTAYFILHGDDTDELRHALRFPTYQGVSHCILPGYGHRLARKLKRQGALPTLVNLAIEGRHHRLGKRLARMGAIPRHIIEADRDGFETSNINTAA